MKLLLEHSGDVNARDNAGWTPFYKATWNGRLEIGKLLLEQGADVNAKDKDGRTPLHEASTEEVGELLKKYGGRE